MIAKKPKPGTFITNRLREVGNTASDIAKELGFGRPYIYQIIHGHNSSWKKKALFIRCYIADVLSTTPEKLWIKPKARNHSPRLARTKKEVKKNLEP